MRKLCKLAAGLLLTLLVTSPAFAFGADKEPAKEADILCTHDLHSTLEGYITTRGMQSGAEPVEAGGFARIKTVIDRQRAVNPDTLVLDAGDYPMGTLYQVLYTTEAPEIRMLGRMGFDATTFGNHDFDYGSEALADMFHVAAASGDPRPAFVINNFDLTSQNTGSQMITKALKEYGYSDYVVLQKGDLKVAVTGTLGYDAIDCAPRCELAWLDPIEYTKKTVAKIKENEDVDMIVLLSHCGTNANPKKSEDEIIAKEIPDIDVIISGHSHSVTKEPIVIKNTTIVSAGCYGYYVGNAHFVQNKKGRWEITNWELIETDSSIPEDPETLKEIQAFADQIDETYLKDFGYTANEVVAVNDYSFESVDDMYQIHTEHRLGDLISDAYRYAVNQTPSGMEHYADVGVAPSGTIRDTYYPGDILVADVFGSFSLGSGADGTVGYPLISLYLTGKELRTVAEVDASVSDLMDSARLYMSGLSFSYNPHRMILNKVNDIWISEPLQSDTRSKLDDKKLYRVVTDMYSGLMLESVTNVSKGLLSVVPKKADGTPVTDFNEVIIYQADGSELKAWDAIMQYMQSFEKDENGVSKIPEYYSVTHNRKVVDDSRNPVSLFKHPNKFGFAACGLLLLLVLLLILIIRLIVRIRRRKIAKRLKEVTPERVIDVEIIEKDRIEQKEDPADASEAGQNPEHNDNTESAGEEGEHV